MKNKLIGLGVIGSLMVSLAAPAIAGSEGRRNTAIGLGAVTAYGLLKGNEKVAVGGALGTAWAYKRYSNEKKREEARKQWHKHSWKKYRR